MKLFATRVWGMGFGRIPLATFGSEGHLNRLLRLAGRGDRLVFVGTQTERTDEENRGRLLGMAEIGFEPLRTLDFVVRTDLDERDFDERGNFRFPHAVALTRAWRFAPAPVLTETISRQLTMLATPGAEEIASAEDVASILRLPNDELVLPALPALERMRRINDILRPTTGPRPTDASYEVNRTASELSWTYAFRFGKRDMYKIGHTKDVRARLGQVNQHIPVELGIECWTVDLQQKWTNAEDAYVMEQKVFSLLESKRSGFERVSCTSSELVTAWQMAIMGG